MRVVHVMCIRVLLRCVFFFLFMCVVYVVRLRVEFMGLLYVFP